MTEAWPIPHVKAAIPRLPANFIRRTEVRRHLARLVADVPVTLVCAPAGYGKTLLLADWVAASGLGDKIWISLDSDDNNPDRFWAGVVNAVRTHAIRRGDDPPDGLLPTDPLDTAGVLAGVVDVLAGLPTPSHLILDDLHEVFGEETLHGITGLVQYLPGNVRLVLSSRAVPPLPLARLRLQGRLAEFGPAELRFSHDDTVALLRAAGIELDRAQVRLLLEQTDGWVAGLRLAARTLREITDYDGFLAEFAGNDRATADYLTSEVLALLPAEAREVLQAVSICDEVTPALAAALSGRDDAGEVLAMLERENSLMTCAERQSFRLHPMPRSFLRAELHRQSPDRAAELHTTAANWFADHDQRDAAFDHAARTGSPSVSTGLLHRFAVPMLLAGDHRTVRRALTAAGDEAVARDPWLALASALAHDEAFEFTEAEADLRRARAAWPLDPDDRLRALRGLVTATHALTTGTPGTVASIDWRDLIRAEENDELEAWARLGQGWALLFAGRLPAAREGLEHAERLARAHGSDFLVLHSLAARGALSGLSGAYAEMVQACTESIAIAESHGWRRATGLALDHVLLGFAMLMRLDPAGALDQLSLAATAGAEPIPPNLSYLSEVIRGAAHYDAGSRVPGLRSMRLARAARGNLSLPVEVLVTGALLEHRAALELGRDTHAREVVTWTSGIAGAVPEVSLMHAHTAFATDDADGLAAAEAAMSEVFARSLPESSPITQIEARLLAAAVEIRRGRRTKARTALATALSLAEPAALIRPFRQADASVRHLLREQIGGFGTVDTFAADVSHALSTVETRSSSTLTEREKAVLARLSTPGSLDEVAAELTMSVNTVKTHIRSVYAKLGVNNRRAAVVAGRELGIS